MKSGSKRFVWFVLVFIVSFLITVGGHFTLKLLDSKPPSIIVENNPKFLSKKKFILNIRINDLISGISHVKVVLSQGLNQLELSNIQLFGEKDHFLKIEVHESSLESFSDNNAKILITASDNSRRRNTISVEHEFTFDSDSPSIKFLAKPETTVSESAYLCFFSVSDPNLEEFFIRDGFQKYLVLPASEYESKFPKDLYFGIFTGNEFVTATDKAGNITEAKCSTKTINQESQPKNLVLAEVLWSKIATTEREVETTSESTQSARIFNDIFPQLSFKPFNLVSNFGDKYQGYSIRGLWIDPLTQVQIGCPTDSILERVLPSSDSQTITLNLGAGLRVILAGIGRAYISQGGRCTPGTILASVNKPFGIYAKVRAKFINPNTLFNSKHFNTNFIKVSAAAKRAIGNIPLTAIESAVESLNRNQP